MKTFDDMTFDDMAEAHAGYALSALLTKGGEGLRSATWAAMNSAIQWRKTQDEKLTNHTLYSNDNERSIRLTIKKAMDGEHPTHALDDAFILGWLQSKIPSLGSILKFKNQKIVYQGAEGDLPVIIRFQPNSRK